MKQRVSDSFVRGWIRTLEATSPNTRELDIALDLRDCRAALEYKSKLASDTRDEYALLEQDFRAKIKELKQIDTVPAMEAISAVIDLRAKLDWAVGALHKYGDHLDDCRILNEDPQPCSCGLLIALNREGL